MVGPYAAAFEHERDSDPFLCYYHVADSPSPILRASATLSRKEFALLAARASARLRAAGVSRGHRVLHLFASNTLEDAALRLASESLGCVPVTVNWQSDDSARVVFKARQSVARAVVYDGAASTAAHLAALREALPALAFIPAAGLVAECEEAVQVQHEQHRSAEEERIVIFTSGTTGDPKEVVLSRGAYDCNAATFESHYAPLLGNGARLVLILVNPMHHTNSTALLDWAMRRPRTQVHLVQRYTTQYWALLESVARESLEEAKKGLVVNVAPLVSRHIDFLAELAEQGRLPVPEAQLRAALGHVDILLGSAPVGPTTVERLLRFAGHAPHVRFGSTETCLQVLGVPVEWSADATIAAFKKGWSHHCRGQDHCGYLIGRPHPPHNDVRIVRAIDKSSPQFAQDVDEGEPGFVITRGGNVFSAYAGNEEATRAAMHNGWYLNLRDVGFWLKSELDGGRDFYWLGRDSELLIRGGANYAYVQVARELTEFVCHTYDARASDFELAVCGLNVSSEHEDSCCVTVDVREGCEGAHWIGAVKRSFVTDARKSVSKGAKPDFVRFAKVPKNFKGAILYPQLREEYGQWIKSEKN